MELTIYHNPQFTKSRAALELVRHKSTMLNIIEYLVAPLKKEDIRALLRTLKMEAMELVRTKEKCWSDLGLHSKSSEEEIINAMLKNRELIERPIVVYDGKAAIGRPIENIIKLFCD